MKRLRVKLLNEIRSEITKLISENNYELYSIDQYIIVRGKYYLYRFNPHKEKIFIYYSIFTGFNRFKGFFDSNNIDTDINSITTLKEFLMDLKDFPSVIDIKNT